MDKIANIQTGMKTRIIRNITTDKVNMMTTIIVTIADAEKIGAFWRLI